MTAVLEAERVNAHRFRCLPSDGLGTAYLTAHRVCDVHGLELEMRRRGQISEADWPLISQRWQRDYSYCFCGGEKNCKLAQHNA